MTQENISKNVRRNNIGVGKTLKAARENKNLSQKEVSRALCLSVAVIEHLEQEQFQDLPGAVFIQGYIRNYAEFLQIPAPVLSVDVITLPKPTPTLNQDKNKHPILLEFVGLLTKINLNYLIGCIFIAILYFAWHERQHELVTPSSLTELTEKVIPFKKIEANQNDDDLNNIIGILKNPADKEGGNDPWRVYDNVKNEVS